ncbi:MAG: hypothetical protein KA319_03700 [Ferruginibacter sp.]|nr:hypothetical protein [Ferruginibacter sp.]
MKKIIIVLATSLFCIPAFAQLNTEQKSIKKVFTDFQSFYLKNEKKFNAFKLYKGQGKENTPPFHIQWKEVDKYFTYLRKNVPYVGEAYIKNEQTHFLYSDSCFKANPNDEIAVGFDYDRWAGGQESIEYMIKWYVNPKNKYKVIIKGGKAILKITSLINKEFTSSEVPFTKEKGKWVMADNVYPTH